MFAARRSPWTRDRSTEPATRRSRSAVRKNSRGRSSAESPFQLCSPKSWALEFCSELTTSCRRCCNRLHLRIATGPLAAPARAFPRRRVRRRHEVARPGRPEQFADIPVSINEGQQRRMPGIGSNRSGVLPCVACSRPWNRIRSIAMAGLMLITPTRCRGSRRTENSRNTTLLSAAGVLDFSFHIGEHPTIARRPNRKRPERPTRLSQASVARVPENRRAALFPTRIGVVHNTQPTAPDKCHHRRRIYQWRGCSGKAVCIGNSTHMVCNDGNHERIRSEIPC